MNQILCFIFFARKFSTNRSVVEAINNVSVINMKKANDIAVIDPNGILRLGRFNSPKCKNNQ